MSEVSDFEIASKLVMYDPVTGKLFWRRIEELCSNNKARNKRYAGKEAGSIGKSGYITLRVNGKFWRAHRLAWLLYYGSIDSEQIDHINCNRTDNRIENLRAASRSDNMQNRKSQNNIMRRSDRSKFWRVQVKNDGAAIVDHFSNFCDAAKCRVKIMSSIGHSHRAISNPKSEFVASLIKETGK